MLNLIKKKAPKIYSLSRNFRNRLKSYKNELNLIDNLHAENIRNVNSIINEKYYDYKKKKFEVDKKKNREFAYVEINNSCNINCLMCDTKSSTRQKKIMDIETVESSIIQIKKMGINRVSLHTIGDPLANPKLDQVFQILRKYDMKTSLSSNGLMLDRRVEILKKYIDVCSDLKFSIDGVTKDTYEKIRFGGSWDELLKNFKLAFKELQPLGYNLSVLCIVMKDNFNELGEFLSFFSKYFKKPHERISLDLLNSLAPNNDYFDKNNKFEKHTHLNKFCSLVSNPIPFILVNGELSVCCRDYDGSLIMGNSKDEDIKTILKGEKFSDLVKAHSEENSNSISNYNLCNSCYEVDERISFIFINFIKMILFKYPDMSGSFYQNKIETIINYLNNHIVNYDYDDFKRELIN